MKRNIIIGSILLAGITTCGIIVYQRPLSADNASSVANFQVAMAVTVPNYVGKFVQKGDSVNVLTTVERNKEKICMTFLQNVPILDIMSNGETTALNIGVSPLEAQFLALAQGTGTLTVAVRQKNHSGKDFIEMSSWSKLFGK